MIIDKILKLKKTNIGYLVSSRRYVSTECKHKLGVVFFGTDLFSIKILTGLNKLYKDKIINKINVVTSASPLASKNKSSKRGRTSHDLVNFRGNQIIQYCIENEIEYHKWDEVKVNNDFEKRLSSFDVGVVASFGHLIPSSQIDAFP